MEHIQIDPAFWFSALVALIVWFSTLKAENNRNRDEIEAVKITIVKIQDKHDNLESELLKDLSEVKQALARIEGRFTSTDKG